MSPLAYSIVDAFTTTSFTGNGAAVVVLDHGVSLSDTTLQLIAAEFNLSETAFVVPLDLNAGCYGLRWFTPRVEVPLCGHATLAAASVLFTRAPRHAERITFETLSGVLTAECLSDGRIQLEFPEGHALSVDDAVGEKVNKALQRAFDDTARTNVTFLGVGSGVSFGKYMLIEVDGIDLEKAAINADSFGVLAPEHTVIILTQRSRTAGETFVSRVFAPALGIPEDPVTGSAHCMLGPYWARQLNIEGMTETVGRQVSARGGVVGIVWDRGKETCRLRGSATLVAKGELYLPHSK